MGVIAISTPPYGKVMHINCSSAVVKRKKIVKANSLVINKEIPIKTYIFPSKPALSNEVLLRPYLELQYPYTLPKELKIDLLWHSAGAFGNEEVKRTSC